MNIKKGDNVIMLQGKDRGKTGKITSLVHGRVVVEGLNTVKRHQRARQQGQVGQIVTKERPVDASNVQLVCPACGKPTRTGKRMTADNKTRTCKKCGADLP